MAEAWEKEVLDAFSDGPQSTLPPPQVGGAANASAPADVEPRGAQPVDVVGRHLDRLMRKVVADLRAYRESTEASFQYASQAQKHMQKLYVVAADDVVDDIPPPLGVPQQGLVQAVKSLFETRFDDHVRGSVQQMHRRLQILLQTYEAMQIRSKGQPMSQRNRLVGLLSSDDAAVTPEESDRAIADMCSLELEEIRKQIVSSLPTTIDMLQTMQTNVYESALRNFTDDRDEDASVDDVESSLTSNASTLLGRNKTLPDSAQAAIEQRSSGGPSSSPAPRELEQRSGHGRKFLFLDPGLAFGIAVGILLAVVREKVLQRTEKISEDDDEDDMESHRLKTLKSPVRSDSQRD